MHWRIFKGLGAARQESNCRRIPNLTSPERHGACAPLLPEARVSEAHGATRENEKSTSQVLFFDEHMPDRLVLTDGQTARCTLPAFRQRVHTRIRFTVPFTFTRTG